MARDFYSVLGIPRNATARQIRERFHQLVRERHPDRYRGEAKARAEAEFQAITEAYNVLSTPEGRRRHDAELHRTDGPSRDEGRAVRAYLQRGVQAYRGGDYAQAARNFELATREEPDNAAAWHNLARAVARDPDRQPKAAFAAVRAAELEPLNATYLKLAGQLQAQVGRRQRAIKLLEQALSWGGDDAEVSRLLEELRKEGRPGMGGFFRRGGRE